MMAGKCPWCGMEKESFEFPLASGTTVLTLNYKCGTWIETETRSMLCKDRQIAQLKAQNAKLEGVAWVVLEAEDDPQI